MNGDFDLDVLRSEAVGIADLAAPDRFAAIEVLISAAAARAGFDPALCGSARSVVLDRERSFPTGLGQEVALPHGFVAVLDRPWLFIGRFPAGVDFQAPDRRPARLVLLLLLPMTEPARRFHLLCLGFIARMVSNPETLGLLLLAPDASQLQEVWRERAAST